MMQDMGAKRGMGTGTKVAIGCGLGCLGLVLAAVIGIGLLGKKAIDIYGDMSTACESFLKAGLSEDPGPAYDLLHPSKQQTVTKEQFVKEWQKLHQKIGNFTSVEPGTPATDYQASNMLLPFIVHGDKGTATVRMGLNPVDQPMRVLDYQIEGGAPAPAAPAAPAKPGG